MSSQLRRNWEGQVGHCGQHNPYCLSLWDFTSQGHKHQLEGLLWRGAWSLAHRNTVVTIQDTLLTCYLHGRQTCSPDSEHWKVTGKVLFSFMLIFVPAQSSLRICLLAEKLIWYDIIFNFQIRLDTNAFTQLYTCVHTRTHTYSFSFFWDGISKGM